jgi:outer membrane protein
MGVVNFKVCVENSKIGKQEQAAFEVVKKKMEDVLEEKEKDLNEMAEKLNDPDQLDLMSPEAETELKRKFRALNQDISQLQSQYYQSLNQTNFKIVQSLAEKVAEASDAVAKDMHLDVVINDEIAFYYYPRLDISDKVVEKMDYLFDEEAKKVTPTKPMP